MDWAGSASGASAATRILIAEDDPSVSTLAVRYLEREGFDVDLAADGEAAIDRALGTAPDLILLDLALPKISGITVLRRIRAAAVPTPVVVISGHRDVDTKIQALKLGADDYLVKPFPLRELAARVEAVLRRASGAGKKPPNLLTRDGLTVDLRERSAFRGDEVIALTELEHAILVHLMQHAGETCSRKQLLRAIWKPNSGNEASVTTVIKRLRSKIEPDARNPRWITTVWGGGYRFGS